MTFDGEFGQKWIQIVISFTIFLHDFYYNFVCFFVQKGEKLDG